MDAYQTQFFKYWLVNFVSFLLALTPVVIAIVWAILRRVRRQPRLSARWISVAVVAGIVEFAVLLATFRDGIAFSYGGLVLIAAPVYAAIAGAATYALIAYMQRHRDPQAAPLRVPLLLPLLVFAMNVAGVGRLAAHEAPGRIAECADAEVLWELAERVDLLEASQLRAALRLAQNAETPAAVLDRLSHHEVLGVREAVARHPHTSAPTLRRLAHDDCFDVRAAAKLRSEPNLPVVTRTAPCLPTN
jgi:hypothetical protein